MTEKGNNSVIPWTIAHQAPVSKGFSRQEDWSGLPFPSPRDLLNPGIEPVSLRSPASAAVFFTTVPPESWPSHAPGIAFCKPGQLPGILRHLVKSMPI